MTDLQPTPQVSLDFTGAYRARITSLESPGSTGSGSTPKCHGPGTLHFRFPQVLQAPIEGPGSTLLVTEGVTGIYLTELHDRPTTYTSGFFRFYRSLQG